MADDETVMDAIEVGRQARRERALRWHASHRLEFTVAIRLRDLRARQRKAMAEDPTLAFAFEALDSALRHASELIDICTCGDVALFSGDHATNCWTRAASIVRWSFGFEKKRGRPPALEDGGHRRKVVPHAEA